MKNDLRIHNIVDKILIIVLIVFTIVRVYLQVKMPLYLQAGAKADDFLFFDYARSILKGKWLGSFNRLTLSKTISFSIFLIMSYLLGIPYSFALIMTYILGIILFISVIKKYISNKYYLYLMYVVLLYSPVMFHIENVQKVYRGGVIVSFSLIVVSSIIGIYNSKTEKLKSMFFYSIIASFSLPFFYFLKEDSIWLVPFVLGAMILTIIYLLFHKTNAKILKIFLTVLPLCSLVGINYIYCSLNNQYYGQYTITDRTGTYLKEVLADIIKIDEKNKIKNVWITKDMFYKAVEASPTLQTIKPEIDKMYEDSWGLVNGQFEGDIIYWTFKETVDEAGIYKKGGKYVNRFYKKIDVELKNAFKNGILEKSNDELIYISPIAEGLSKQEIIDYYKEVIPKSITMIVTYNENEVGIYEAYGDDEDIYLMDRLTNSVTVWPKENKKNYPLNTLIVNHSKKIVSIYQKTGILILVLGIIGLFLLTINVVIDMIKKRNRYNDLLLITVGLLGTVSILLFGVQWFSRWCENSLQRHIYNYSCGIVPIIQIVELIGMYIMIQTIADIVKKIKVNGVVKSEKRVKKRARL